MRSKCVFLSGNAFKNALKENENNSRCDNKNLKNLRYEVNIKEKRTSKALRVCLNFDISFQPDFLILPKIEYFGKTGKQRLQTESICLRHKCQLTFFSRLTNPLLPYTIRLRSLNLLLFPSTNPELSGWDIAFLTGAISLFISLQNAVSFPLLYLSRNSSIFSGSFPIRIVWNSLNTVSI